MQRVSYFSRVAILLFISLLSTNSTIAQSNQYKKIIDDFAIASANNLNFINGINIYIEKPESDEDALYKGFRIVHSNREYNGGWEILYAQTITIDMQPHPQEFRAVLYEHLGKKRIVLYRKEAKNKYYFRIFKTSYTP